MARVAHLLALGVAADKIRPITFTVVAAAELKDRIALKMPTVVGTPRVSTLHALALALLGDPAIMEPEGKAEKELVFVVLLEQEWPEERLLRLRGAFQAQVLQPPPLSGRDLGALRHLCADMCVKAGVGAPGPQGSRVPDEALRAFEQQRDCMEPLRVAAGKVSDLTDPDRADKARKEFLSCGGPFDDYCRSGDGVEAAPPTGAARPHSLPLVDTAQRIPDLAHP